MKLIAHKTEDGNLVEVVDFFEDESSDDNLETDVSLCIMNTVQEELEDDEW